MGPYEQVIHVLNFIAPAWGVALMCALVARFLGRGWLPVAPWGVLSQSLVGSLLGALVLCAGVWLLGADGKMATYGALVVTCATAQWWMCSGWRSA